MKDNGDKNFSQCNRRTKKKGKERLGKLFQNNIGRICELKHEATSDFVGDLDNSVEVLDNSVEVLDNSVEVLDNSVEVLDGSVEVLDGSDMKAVGIKKSFSHNLDSKLNLGEQLINGNNRGAIETIDGVIYYPKLKIETGALIKNQLNQMKNNPSIPQVKEGSGYIYNMVEISLENEDAGDEINTPQALEKRKYLESLKQLFGTIKQGCEKGFDKVKNSINFTFEKVMSLGKSKITTITDKIR